MDNKLKDFIVMLQGRISFDVLSSIDAKEVAIYSKILKDIKEIKDELDSKKY